MRKGMIAAKAVGIFSLGLAVGLSVRFLASIHAPSKDGVDSEAVGIKTPIKEIQLGQRPNDHTKVGLSADIKALIHNLSRVDDIAKHFHSISELAKLPPDKLVQFLLIPRVELDERQRLVQNRLIHFLVDEHPDFAMNLFEDPSLHDTELLSDLLLMLVWVRPLEMARHLVTLDVKNLPSYMNHLFSLTTILGGALDELGKDKDQLEQAYRLQRMFSDKYLGTAVNSNVARNFAEYAPEKAISLALENPDAPDRELLLPAIDQLSTTDLAGSRELVLQHQNIIGSAEFPKLLAAHVSQKRYSELAEFYGAFDPETKIYDKMVGGLGRPLASASVDDALTFMAYLENNNSKQRLYTSLASNVLVDGCKLSDCWSLVNGMTLELEGTYRAGGELLMLESIYKYDPNGVTDFINTHYAGGSKLDKFMRKKLSRPNGE